jgi:hypothetical protein
MVGLVRKLLILPSIVVPPHLDLDLVLLLLRPPIEGVKVVVILSIPELDGVISSPSNPPVR